MRVLGHVVDDRDGEISVQHQHVRPSERRGQEGAILHTKGYINNVGGEEIASRAYELMDAGCRTLLLDLRETKIVNSIGISIRIEIIEAHMDEVDITSTPDGTTIHMVKYGKTS